LEKSVPPETQRTADPDIDETDLEILRVLSDRADITNKALAQRLGLAESTCAHRVRMLKRRGVIRGVRVTLDTGALGAPLHGMIRVRLSTHTKQSVTALFDSLVQIPGAVSVYHVGGSDDFLVHVAVADAAALRDIVLEHITVHPVVRGTETQLIFDVRDGVGVLDREDA
jgi:DNA-binding Lrp family transcriptional regulator